MADCIVAMKMLHGWELIFYKVLKYRLVFHNYFKFLSIRKKKKTPLFINVFFFLNKIIAEMSDYQPEEHCGNYASELKLFAKQSLNLEQTMMDLHRTELKGQSLEETEANFLRKACTLDSYGVDPHPVKVSYLHAFNLERSTTWNLSSRAFVFRTKKVIKPT